MPSGGGGQGQEPQLNCARYQVSGWPVRGVLETRKVGGGPKQADRLESVNFEVKLLNNGVAITVSQ